MKNFGDLFEKAATHAALGNDEDKYLQKQKKNKQHIRERDKDRDIYIEWESEILLVRWNESSGKNLNMFSTSWPLRHTIIN